VFATNWLEVGGVAQLVAAAATVGLAGVTAAMAIRTHEVAKETKGLVGVSLREAQATEALAIEARTDRQLAWLPQLELVRYTHPPNSFGFEVRNTGPGPALRVVCMAREMENIGKWAIVHMGDFRPGELKEEDGRLWTGVGAVISPFEGIPGLTSADVVTIVLLCSDVLGRRFRFGYAKGVHLPPDNITVKALPPNVSTISEDHPWHTDWADEPLVWG
jgi:hypothetical protein